MTIKCINFLSCCNDYLFLFPVNMLEAADRYTTSYSPPYSLGSLWLITNIPKLVVYIFYFIRNLYMKI